MNTAKRMARKAEQLRAVMRGITVAYNSTQGPHSQLHPANFERALAFAGNGEIIAQTLERWKFRWHVVLTVWRGSDEAEEAEFFTDDMLTLHDMSAFVEDDLLPQLDANGCEWGYIAKIV